MKRQVHHFVRKCDHICKGKSQKETVTSMHWCIGVAFIECPLYTMDCSRHWENREVNKTSPVFHVTYLLEAVERNCVFICDF